MGELLYLDDNRRKRNLPPAPNVKDFENWADFFYADLVYRMVKSRVENGVVAPEIMDDFEKISQPTIKEQVQSSYEEFMSDLNERMQ